MRLLSVICYFNLSEYHKMNYMTLLDFKNLLLQVIKEPNDK